MMLSLSEVLEQLNQLDLVRFEELPDGHSLRIENELSGFCLLLNVQKILDFQWVVSPFGEDCLQFFLVDGGMLILTPNDYVFDVQQDGFVQVENLPPICSVRELLMGFEDYQINPIPSHNYDENLGLFYLHLYIFRSAENHGITIPLMDELLRIGKENDIWMYNSKPGE